MLDKRLDKLKNMGGHGFIYKDKVCVMECPKCHRNNKEDKLTSGICGRCGFDANKEEEDDSN